MNYESLILKLLNNMCFNTLNEIDVTNIDSQFLTIFFKLLNISIILTITSILVYLLYNVFYKKYSLKGFILEYKGFILQYIFIYILNILTILVFNEFLTNSLNKFEYLFKQENSMKNTILLITYTLLSLILILQQIMDYLESLILMLFSPFFMFKKKALQNLKNRNYKNIFNTLFLDAIYLCIINTTNLNQGILVLLLFACISSGSHINTIFKNDELDKEKYFDNLYKKEKNKLLKNKTKIIQG